jgi:S-adenosylmethionine hydrolase
VIDLTHGIPRHDVQRGAAALARALPFTAPGIHLAVVDPGVGTKRRPLAVRVAQEDRILVGPDNGVLSRAISVLGGAVEAVDLAESEFALKPVSATFHGRDIFAPVAAQIAKGASINESGEPFGPESLFRVSSPEPVVEAGRMLAHVADIDGFGNVALDAAAEHLIEAAMNAPDGAAESKIAHEGRPFAAGRFETAGMAARDESVGNAVVYVAGFAHRAIHGRAFGDAPEGDLLLYMDSSGRVALAVNRGSAASELGLEPGDEVEIRLDALR